MLWITEITTKGASAPYFTMIPHQIYCDYLEDKGIDCRLLRTIDLESLVCTSHPDYQYKEWNPGSYPGTIYVTGDGEIDWEEDVFSTFTSKALVNGYGDGLANYYGDGLGCGYFGDQYNGGSKYWW